MAFWSRLFSTPNHEGIVPNSNGPSNWVPGDPEGVTVETPDPVELRSFPVVMPSPPAELRIDGWRFRGSRIRARRRRR